MTYSIGFRAPSSKDLLFFFGDHAASTVVKPDDFYRDPDLQKQDNPGEASSIACSTSAATQGGGYCFGCGKRFVLLRCITPYPCLASMFLLIRTMQVMSLGARHG